MSSRDAVRALFQGGYYDAVDRGDMAAAASIFTEAVDWSHAQVWAHHDYARDRTPTVLTSRAAVEAFLAERKDKLAEAGIRHKVSELVLDGDRGALLGRVEGEGKALPFMVWFELEGGRVSRYTLRPL